MASIGPPTGTVTFWFSDIEGSTLRWERNAAAMHDLLRRHDAIVRAAIEGHGGYVFKTIGDAFCAAFARAEDAAASALAAHRELARADFSAVDGMLIRVALHTGVADERDGDYFGPAVNRVARLLATSWGGQTVLSAAAAELVRVALAPEATLRDLGEHRLKDLLEPEHVWDLLAPELPSEFPPLRSVDVARHNLPTQLSPLIGREDVVAEIERTLADARLVTLAATGGVGKTRTALHVAADLVERFADGVWYVELASISADADVAAKVLADLGVRETGSRTALESVLLWLASREALLVLDNCEQVVGGAALVASRILARCPRVRVLATSREALDIAGERVVHVPGMRVPSDGQTLTAQDARSYEAIELFVERARASGATFELSDANAGTVAEICRRLDGIALAIELAASRVRVLSPSQVAKKLDERFRLLTGGRREAVPRQATLHAMISWSYELLEERERHVIETLSMFASSWSIDAGVELCRDDTLDDMDALDAIEALARKSLVAVEGDSETKSYRLLESTRAFALAKLRERGAEAETRARHAAHALRVAERLDVAALSSPTARWESDAMAAAADVRAAIAWALVDGNDEALGVELVARLRWFWSGISPSEGRTEIRRAIEVAKRIAAEADTVARLHIGLANVSPVFVDYEQQLTSAAEACELLGGNDRLEKALANRLYAQALAFNGSLTQAAPLVESVLAEFRVLGQPRYVSLTLHDRGLQRFVEGDCDGACSDLTEAAAIANEHGFERDLLALHLNLGEIEFERGNLGTAVALARSVVARKYALREPIMFAMAWSNLAMYYSIDRRWSEAMDAARCALGCANEGGAVRYRAYAMQSMASVLAERGDAENAAALLGFVDARLGELGVSRGDTERAQYDRLVRTLGAHLDADRVDEQRRFGSTLSQDAAQSLALRLPLEATA
jgi:predicted ATPase/class 3 adenylate cyclase